MTLGSTFTFTCTLIFHLGYTALHYSVIWCQDECTKVLLASGASVAVTTVRGETANDVAVRYKNWAACELLEKQGFMISNQI